MLLQELTHRPLWDFELSAMNLAEGFVVSRKEVSDEFHHAAIFNAEQSFEFKKHCRAISAKHFKSVLNPPA